MSFSVKSYVIRNPNQPRRAMFDGPWKKTPEEALQAYVEKLRNSGESCAFQVFLAEGSRDRNQDRDVREYISNFEGASSTSNPCQFRISTSDPDRTILVKCVNLR